VKQLADVEESQMSEDPRCCGSDMCIIDTEGRCWCGQQWDSDEMCHAPLAPAEPSGHVAGGEVLVDGAKSLT
jgi:hypothetical protein